VVLVAVPSRMASTKVIHEVDEPLELRTCPVVPVALLESLNSPVILSFSTVDEAR
jgi:hypothetical protein